MAIVLGAVAYDPKVVTIWDGFRTWLREHDLNFDYLLFSNYEAQVEGLLDGTVSVAWNSPLAWVRTRRLATALGVDVRPVSMRDTDRDLTTAVVVRKTDGATSLHGLRGAVVGVGAIDSPQATILPLSLIREAGLQPGTDLTVRRHEEGVGLHGDHIGGERTAAIALMNGEVDAACVTDSNLLLFIQEGSLDPNAVRVLAQTAPYDHCNLTSGPAADDREINRLVTLLESMSYADGQLRPLLDLEGLKAWLPGRVDGYDRLERAVDEAGFYDEFGRIIDASYRP